MKNSSNKRAEYGTMNQNSNQTERYTGTDERPLDRANIERPYRLQPDGEREVYADRDGIIRDNSAESEDESDDGYQMNITELLYSTASFNAILMPVVITMILAALAVVFVNTDESVEAGADAMAGAYQVWKTNDESKNYSTVQQVGVSLANGLVMVSVICMMTFVIVLLYRFECMKCLIGYMMFCSTTLLGFLGGNMWYMAIEIYNLPVDKLSYVWTLWNFAIVGVISIFYGKGIPKVITQGYLVATAVILAWHLDYFDEITTWTLLVMLAFYDLCAVLTPCGPLKALVNLMSKEGAPDMPGLLYEAQLPPEARRPGTANNSNSSNRNSSNNSHNNNSGTGNHRGGAAGGQDDAWDSQNPQVSNEDDGSGVWDDRSEQSGPLAEIPLAIARVYNLPVIDVSSKARALLDNEGAQTSGGTGRPNRTPLLQDSATVPSIPENPSPALLRSEVTVRLPSRGGRIEKLKKNGKVAYLERDRHGEAKRLLWVDESGRVFADSDDGDDENGNTIKLGLGDFIFYSVMVGKAAQYSFTTFAACFLVILAGLGGTLVLLAVYHQALPALPISIFLGVFFYLCTRVLVEPWIEDVLMHP
eukprot:CAMPEP_0119556884 /NCGR_PEP_ID=MMETSP1352-20130426/8701_1 /TAXON_ID=265584 /ORGANISM="Stauroneis constricta, Strain CCMP1120" /LENGTH=589 /DNA_ID=CAMNT_0007603895 /DNA_START=1 /DNA_END=1766 /DNA_ORIENTATION=+